MSNIEDKKPEDNLNRPSKFVNELTSQVEADILADYKQIVYASGQFMLSQVLGFKGKIVHDGYGSNASFVITDVPSNMSDEVIREQSAVIVQGGEAVTHELFGSRFDVPTVKRDLYQFIPPDMTAYNLENDLYNFYSYSLDSAIDLFLSLDSDIIYSIAEQVVNTGVKGGMIAPYFDYGESNLNETKSIFPSTDLSKLERQIFFDYLSPQQMIGSLHLDETFESGVVDDLYESSFGMGHIIKKIGSGLKQVYKNNKEEINEIAAIIIGGTIGYFVGREFYEPSADSVFNEVDMFTSSVGAIVAYTPLIIPKVIKSMFGPKSDQRD